MLAIYVLAVGSVAGLCGWRFGRTLSWRGSAAVLGALLGAALPVWLALGPLSYHPKPWNLASFSDRLQGQILSQQAPTKAIVSMAGTANGDQRVLVRADLLLGQTGSEQTALQLEYIPSGLHCTGQIDHVAQSAFSGHCRLSDGSGQRNVTANWQLTGVSSNLLGTLDVQPRG